MLLFFVNNSRNNTTKEYHWRKNIVAVITQDSVIDENLRRKIKNRTLYACRLFPEFFNILAVAGVQPEICQGRGGFMELGDFDKHFDTRKRALQGKKIGLSSPRYS